MITIQINPRSNQQPARQWSYLIAGQEVRLDEAIPSLAAFEKGSALSRRIETPGPDSAISPATLRLIYRGPGWIHNQWREISCWAGSQGYLLEIPAAASFSVSQDGSLICLRATSTAPRELIHEIVMGPALILALALHGVWCLHASAVATPQGAILFLGESGKGKSTLAAFAGSQQVNGWQAIADDIVPARAGSDGVEAWVQYPQLKLPWDAQPSVDFPGPLPIRAVYQLGEAEPESETIQIRPLSDSEATLALVRHTVAAVLFDASLLQAHLDFCTQMSAQVPVRRLYYPRRFERLESLVEAIRNDLNLP